MLHILQNQGAFGRYLHSYHHTSHANPFGTAAEGHQVTDIPLFKVDLPTENNFDDPCLVSCDHPDLSANQKLLDNQ
jgi:hypothetical protein